MLWLKRPANKCGKSAATILLIADVLQMLDPVFNRFHMTKHHGGAGFQSQFVRDLHHFKPLLAVAFQGRYSFADAVDQNFAAAAGDRSKPCLFEFQDHFAQRHAKRFGEMLKLRRAESVDVNVRIFFADVMQKIEVPGER